jgi:hypothetical protein
VNQYLKYLSFDTARTNFYLFYLASLPLGHSAASRVHHSTGVFVPSLKGHTPKFQEWILVLTDLGSLFATPVGTVFKKAGDGTLADDTKKNIFGKGASLGLNAYEKMT